MSQFETVCCLLCYKSANVGQFLTLCCAKSSYRGPLRSVHVVLIIPCPQLLPRTKFLLAPLTEKVSSLEGELNSLTKQITAKQVRLGRDN